MRDEQIMSSKEDLAPGKTQPYPATTALRTAFRAGQVVIQRRLLELSSLIASLG